MNDEVEKNELKVVDDTYCLTSCRRRTVVFVESACT